MIILSSETKSDTDLVILVTILIVDGSYPTNGRMVPTNGRNTTMVSSMISPTDIYCITFQ